MESTLAKESLKADNNLEPYEYLVTVHVHSLFHHPVGDESPFCFMKGNVTSSQNVTNKAIEAWVCLSKEDGTVYCTHC